MMQKMQHDKNNVKKKKKNQQDKSYIRHSKKTQNCQIQQDKNYVSDLRRWTLCKNAIIWSLYKQHYKKKENWQDWDEKICIQTII